MNMLPAIQAGCEMGLFRTLTESEEPLSIESLSEQTGAAPTLLRRILRYLTSNGEVTETGKDCFEANYRTQALAAPAFQDSIYWMFNIGNPTYQRLPETLRKNGNTDSSKELPFQRAFNTDMAFFGWSKQHPEYLRTFQSLMTVPHDGDWTNVISIPSLAMSVTAEQAVVVDIGGNVGHQSARLRARYPDLPGRIIVQDLPETIQNAEAIEGVEFMVHNFFEPQPIKGAKVYYIRNILHDWDDEKSTQILKSLVPAMDAHSLVVIDDMAVPDTGSHWWPACLDIIMFSFFGALERTESQWTDLVSGAGLKLIDIKSYNSTTVDSIIIASLP
ncbi:OmtB [Penicillium atrosanguineum]|uniref:OmtB n=1 Tax=Penicillium atrosanguineum TaxID=1132637 RepID=A0A9W9QB24_9EURO|nr:OmtB [Penicillium atrosanguineum]